MTAKKTTAILAGFILSASLLSASFTALLLTGCYQRAHFQALETICQDAADAHPEAAQTVLSALKKSTLSDAVRTAQKNRSGSPAAHTNVPLLQAYGYQPGDFLKPSRRVLLYAAAGFLAGGVLFLCALLFRRRKEEQRLKSLADSLSKWNTLSDAVRPPHRGMLYGMPFGYTLSDAVRPLFQTGGDEFSKLQDEIYKTVTHLYQTRDAALQARQDYAENLSNIAHQIRTPITAISLAAQMMSQDVPSCRLEQIRRQLSRLTRLEESLLLLSRIDAGALPLVQRDADVFTILTLAADGLQEICSEAGVSVEIPEAGEISIHADLDWTVEAVMNLMKNCVEHTPPGGSVRCDYEQNPLYTRICIRDMGDGFAKEDLPHLFERFYRGRNAKTNGIGIGLSLSREIMERQNGMVSAYNPHGGGACFEIRCYRCPM